MGPSFPKLRPAATASMIPIDLISRVHLPRNPRMMKPLRIVLIFNNKKRKFIYLFYLFIFIILAITSGIPPPDAYGANIRTRMAARAPNPTAQIT